MLVMDMPNIPLQEAPIFLHVEAVQFNATKKQIDAGDLDGVMGVCYLRPSNVDYSSLAPREDANYVFWDAPKASPQVELDYENAEVTVLQSPEHGTLSHDLSPGSTISYTPKSGYMGNDKVVFLVNIEGHKIKVVYFVKVLGEVGDIAPEALYQKYCPIPSSWKISSTGGDAPFIGSQAPKAGLISICPTSLSLLPT